MRALKLGGNMLNDTITFEEIGKFISANLLWFLIPINVILIALFTWIIVRAVKNKKKKEGKKNERKRQNKLSKPH